MDPRDIWRRYSMGMFRNRPHRGQQRYSSRGIRGGRWIEMSTDTTPWKRVQRRIRRSSDISCFRFHRYWAHFKSTNKKDWMMDKIDRGSSDFSVYRSKDVWIARSWQIWRYFSISKEHKNYMRWERLLYLFLLLCTFLWIILLYYLWRLGGSKKYPMNK